MTTVQHGLWRAHAATSCFCGGWTECEVAELRNGSVLMTSRTATAPHRAKVRGHGPQ